MSVDDDFVKALGDLQTGLISLCMEFVSGKAEKVFAYGYIQNRCYVFKAAYVINNTLMWPDWVENVSQDTVSQFLFLGIDDLRKIDALCKQYGKPCPVQTKMTYDVVTGRYNCDMDYTPQTSETITWEDLFRDWVREEFGEFPETRPVQPSQQVQPSHPVQQNWANSALGNQYSASKYGNAPQSPSQQPRRGFFSRLFGR